MNMLFYHIAALQTTLVWYAYSERLERYSRVCTICFLKNGPIRAINNFKLHFIILLIKLSKNYHGIYYDDK